MNPSTRTLPVLPLRNAVLFPRLGQPAVAGRAESISAVESAIANEGREVFVVSQRDPSVETPGFDDLHTVGTVSSIKKVARLPNGSLQILLQGIERGTLLRIEESSPHLEGRIKPAPLKNEGGTRIEALLHEVHSLAKRYLEAANIEVPAPLSQALFGETDAAHLAFFLATILDLETEKEQTLLASDSVEDALLIVHSALTHALQVFELRSRISSEAQSEMNREQREYVLRQQLRAIQKELGESDGSETEIDDLRDSISKLDLPEAVRKEAERELTRLGKIPVASPEHGTLRGYLEFLAELPWGVESDSKLEIAAARKVLEDDHFGLEKVKERILEHLGVLKLNPDAKTPILCFVGPPGVGKTSLGQSIARALNRSFERMSLGGLHDEAELRGHRRTYIGAMPGRILQALRRAGVSNPVLMLDEIDKLGRDYRGDPAAALLEILDPEQNREFRDNFLDLPFDLSRALFIVTANTLETIPPPLLDRLEVVRFSGYTDEEKVEIAKRYLLPRSLADVGLDAQQCAIDEGALKTTVSGYTREAGVRQLTRQIGKITRKVALRFAEETAKHVTISEDDVAPLLGPEKFFLDTARETLSPGVIQGLAWTPSGGEVLYIETSLLPDQDRLTLTGQLGDVMRESATTARSYVLAHAKELGIDPSALKGSGVHIHVPAGAIPKDGPSAGITMATALTSIYTGRVPRKDTAMTGEITLTGLVLPIGGVKEKVLAARRAGIRRVVLPADNKKDMHELPDYVTRDVELVFAKTLREALEEALEPADKPKLRKVG